uniref:Uncharacterized protein n=1 Tax=Oryza minuta TaxID=63629 RepID=G9C381_ORYMI|nr:hypothetical protein [Oryza minuta]
MAGRCPWQYGTICSGKATGAFGRWGFLAPWTRSTPLLASIVVWYRWVPEPQSATTPRELNPRKPNRIYQNRFFFASSGLESKETAQNSRSISILRELETLACCTFHVLCGVSFSYGRRFTAVRDLLQGQMTSMDKAANVVLDNEGLPQQPDKCCTGSPKMTRALSRKGSNRMERRSGEEQEQDDLVKKLIIKVVPSQLEQLKMPLVQNKALVTPQSQCASCAPILTDSGEGRNKKFNRLTSVHPRKILLFFATLSSVGTMILIYFTLAINGGKAEA